MPIAAMHLVEIWNLGQADGRKTASLTAKRAMKNIWGRRLAFLVI